MSPDTLTPLDTTFLELEDADASAHMHIGGILLFPPRRPDAPAAPTITELRRHVERRLPALPRYRQRLSADHVGRLNRPTWVDMPRFDIERHVRHAALPAPGGSCELRDLTEDFFSRRLDRTGPLWELLLVDGLDDGSWALCAKTHHCLVDGVGSIDIAYVILDTDAHPADTTSPAPPVGADLRTASWWTPARRATELAFDLARHPAHVGGLLERAAAMARVVVEDEVRAAPASSLNAPIGGRRRLREVSFGLDEARAVRQALGGTVNDVVLAGVTGGLRALLLTRGEEPPTEGLRAMVPVNIRREEEQGALGNRITSLFVELPVAEEAPLARYELVRERTAALKRSKQGLGSDTIVELAGLSPPILHTVLAQSLFGKRLFNVTVTNVPGPQFPLSLLGTPLEAIYPLVPLAAEHAVGIAVLSYLGRLDFGINVDHELVPDVDVLADGLAASLAELGRFAGATDRGVLRR